MVTRHYDHPAHTVPQQVTFQDQGSTSTAKRGRWTPGADVVVDLIYGVVSGANAAATDVYNIYSGTTSIGTYAIGTATGTWTVAGSSLSTNTLSAGTQLSIAVFGTGATDVTYVYHVNPTNTVI